MSEIFHCDDKDTLVAYLYGESDPVTRREVERHLRTCTACADEVHGLNAVRSELEAWQPPDAELGFTIVPKAAPVLRPSRWSGVSASTWTQAAAAVLVLAAGAAIANVQISYTAQGLRVSTGWMTPAQADVRAGTATEGSTAAAASPSAAPASVVSPSTVNADDLRAALAALEDSLRREMSEVRRVSLAQARQDQGGAPDSALLQRVEALISESERRQRQELGVRIAQVARDVDVRRTAELVRLQQDVWRTAATQQDLMNYVRRVSAPTP